MKTSSAAKLQNNQEQRRIHGVFRAPGMHWVGDGFRVAGYFNAIPDAMRKLDPFVMLDYGPEHYFEPTTHRRGVGGHPHRGFETVTIAFQGSVAHKDSTGSGGVIHPGDVQWMTAGSGILHNEFHETEFAKRGGHFQMAQLWVNLPRAHKMTAPSYQPLLAGQMGAVSLPNDAGTGRVIAGELFGSKGPAKTFSPIGIYDLQLKHGGKFQLPVEAGFTLAILVLKGSLSVNDQAAAQHDFVLFERGQGVIELAADSKTQLLVLSGAPLNEPIVQYGPFVMNTEQEIMQAFSDFRAGKFGHLED